MLLLGGAQLADVELELLALEDVAVAAAGLARARGDGGVETAGGELVLEERVDLGVCSEGERQGQGKGKDEPFLRSAKMRSTCLDRLTSSAAAVSAVFAVFFDTGVAY